MATRKASAYISIVASTHFNIKGYFKITTSKAVNILNLICLYVCLYIYYLK